MKPLANENFPRSAVEAHRAIGHDVLRARSDLNGATDDVILARAVADQRVLITFDKDFGELAVVEENRIRTRSLPVIPEDDRT